MWQGSAGKRTGVEVKGQRSWDSSLPPPDGLWESGLVGNASSHWVISLVPFSSVNGTLCICFLTVENWALADLVLKWDDSRLKWTSHLIQMLLKIGPSGTKEMAHWLRALNDVQFPASTWHQTELQLSDSISCPLLASMMLRHTCQLNTHTF